MAGLLDDRQAASETLHRLGVGRPALGDLSLSLNFLNLGPKFSVGVGLLKKNFTAYKLFVKNLKKKKILFLVKKKKNY